VTVNPLVAGPVNTSSAFGGAGVVESVTDLCSALTSGNWVAAGLAGVGTALDVAATVSDPLGSLIGAGLGWLMEHLEPLKGWLNDLTGDAGAVLGFAATWENVATAMGAAGEELTRVVHADLEAMSGSAITAYATYADGLAEQIRATGASASAIGGALKTCAMVVQVVHDLVRDTLAQLVGSIISWAAEAVFTLGLATPVIVEQVTTRVSSLAAKIGRSVADVISSAKSLKALLEALKEALSRLAKATHGKLPGARGIDAPKVRTPDAPAVHAPDLPTTNALPDISDIPHPKNGGDLDEWANAVAARHPDLTPDEVKGIYRYTTQAGYKEMNGFLRDPSSFSPSDAARIQKDVDDAVAGLGKLPTAPIDTMRGTNLPDSVLAGYQPGQRVSDPAFWSTTTTQKVAEDFRGSGNAFINIRGQTGVDVQALSHYGNEAEILMRPGTDFVVKTREWVAEGASGYWKFLVEEVVP